MEIMNPGEKHVACVLVVDTSGSMNEKGAINELNKALAEFGQAIKSDEKAAGCADICIISFNSNVKIELNFCPGYAYEYPVLEAVGLTKMNEAIITALDMIDQRKAQYREAGIDYWRPWLFLLTDGLPNDIEWDEAAHQRMQNALNAKVPELNFWPMAIGDADITCLKSYTRNGNGIVLKANKANFKEAFIWLSNSISQVSNSTVSNGRIKPPPLPDDIAWL